MVVTTKGVSHVLTLRERLTNRYPNLPEPPYQAGDTALMVIDVQYGDAHPDHGVLKAMRDRGDGDLTTYYVQRLKEHVIPNISMLQQACRQAGIEVIHVGIQSLTRDGRDRSREHKNASFHFAPGSVEAQFLDEIAPDDDEIVITKTCSGVFNGTNINYVLRNLGIVNLIMCGVFTNGCVETAVRDAADLSYLVTMVDDACASWSDEIHAASIGAMRNIYAKVLNTSEVVARVQEGARANATTNVVQAG